MSRGVLIDQDMARRLAEMLRWYQRNGRSLIARPRRSVDVAATGRPTMLKVIGTTGALGTHRWEYLVALPDDSMAAAINLMEDDNAEYKAGPSYVPNEFPAGFELLPIGELKNGNRVECIVPGWFNADDERWEFCATNVPDGDCGGTFAVAQLLAASTEDGDLVDDTTETVSESLEIEPGALDQVGRVTVIRVGGIATAGTTTTLGVRLRVDDGSTVDLTSLGTVSLPVVTDQQWDCLFYAVTRTAGSSGVILVTPSGSCAGRVISFGTYAGVKHVDLEHALTFEVTLSYGNSHASHHAQVTSMSIETYR